MPSHQTLLGGAIGGVILLIVIFGLFAATGAALSQMQQTGPSSACGSLSSSGTPGSSGSRAHATPPATPDTSSGDCFPGNPYGAQVVQWARKMADALYVNPACGARRGGPDCNDTYYTSAFPAQVIAYGQNWCRPRGDCADWA